MEYNCQPETFPSPVAFPPSQKKDYSNCTYLCFSTDSYHVDLNDFNIKSNYHNLTLQKQKINNKLIFCIYSEGFINTAVKFFISVYYFEIAYQSKNSKKSEISPQFTVEKGKIKFIFESGNKGFEKVAFSKIQVVLNNIKHFVQYQKIEKRYFKMLKIF